MEWNRFPANGKTAGNAGRCLLCLGVGIRFRIGRQYCRFAQTYPKCKITGRRHRKDGDRHFCLFSRTIGLWPVKRYSCWNFGLLEIRFGEGECSAVGENNLKGAGGPDALQTSSPVRSLSRVDTYPHAALRALLVGLRPPTPQSPERLRSTPFDCVAIAPCCFAERKAVLSHALAALTALRFPCAVKAVEICFAALTALRFPCAGQVFRDADRV